MPNGGLKKATFQAKSLELDLCSVRTEEKKKLLLTEIIANFP